MPDPSTTEPCAPASPLDTPQTSGESVHVEIVLPAVDDGYVSSGLYELSKALGTLDPEAQSHGFLGGEWGYGQDFANDVFMMHPFCWCERDDCEWCAGCECPESAFHYFVDGVEVGFDQWSAFWDAEMGDEEPDYMDTIAMKAWEGKANGVNARRDQRHDPECRVCRGEWGNKPHFEHFASGVEVRWYKYIGRDMEVSREVTMREWNGILADCLASLESEHSGGSRPE